MVTAKDYNTAVRDLTAIRMRNQELETRHAGQMMRIEELMEAVETVNNAGVLKARRLEACNAVLEDVREVGVKLKEWFDANTPWTPEACGGLISRLTETLAAAEEHDAAGG